MRSVHVTWVPGIITGAAYCIGILGESLPSLDVDFLVASAGLLSLSQAQLYNTHSPEPALYVEALLGSSGLGFRS